MPIGLLGKKEGMTRFFTEGGESIPVTVIKVEANKISQTKNTSVDGYNAVQVAAFAAKMSRTNKPKMGQFSKAGIKPMRFLKEFRVDSIDNYQLGQEITLDVLTDVKKVNVEAVSKGKGFSGGVKRHNFKMQDATHGNSRSHRAIGSTGQNQDPGKVFKGKKMAGQYGNKRCTVKSLKVIDIQKDKNILLVKGAVPGASGSVVVIFPQGLKDNAKGAE